MTAILFDLDDTLIDDTAATEAALLATCALARDAHGIPPATLAAALRREAGERWRASPTIGYCRAIGISSLEGLRAAFTGDDPDLMRLRSWGPTYGRSAWAAALVACGVADSALAEKLADAYAAARGAGVSVFPEVPAVLAALGRAHRLGLVTNGAPDLQRAKLAGSGLGHHFAAVVVSGEVGAGKPNARPFAAALAALGAAPGEAVMVGDSWERDVLGARQAGVRPVLIDRSGWGAAAAREGVARIGDLRQLGALL